VQDKEGKLDQALAPLDESGKQALRDAWDQFMKPYLRGQTSRLAQEGSQGTIPAGCLPSAL
jgi:hypothetical protein